MEQQSGHRQKESQKRFSDKKRPGSGNAGTDFSYDYDVFFIYTPQDVIF
jgi:hypothetical protein